MKAKNRIFENNGRSTNGPMIATEFCRMIVGYRVGKQLEK